MRPCPTVRILGGNKAWHNGHGLWCRVPFPYGRRCLFLLVAFATHESLSAPVPSVRSFSRFPPQSGITSAARPHKGKVGSANTVCSNRCLASDSPTLRTFLLVRSGRLSRISFPALSASLFFHDSRPTCKSHCLPSPKVTAQYRCHGTDAVRRPCPTFCGREGKRHCHIPRSPVRFPSVAFATHEPHTTTISKQSLFHVFHPQDGITACFPSAEVRMISRRPNPYSLRKPPCRLPGSPTSEGQSPLQWQR